MPNPLLSLCAVAAAATLVPAIAIADEAFPADEPPPVAEPPDAEPPVAEPTPPPPIAPPAAAPVAAAPDPCAEPAAGERPCGAPARDRWCGGSAHSRWSSRARGHFAIGLSSGHVEMEDETEGTQKSLIARFTGRRGWAVELELSKLKLGDDDGRLAGGSLVKTFGSRKLAPYVIAGVGGGRLEHAGGGESRVGFGEIGAGLVLRGRRLSIGVDVRRGVREVEADEVETMAPVAERRVSSGDDDRERYTRGRIVALIHF